MTTSAATPKPRPGIDWTDHWPVAVMAIGLLVILLILVVPFFAAREVIFNRKRRSRLRRQGRILTWDEAKIRVMDGDGVLLLELLGDFGIGDTWWIANSRFDDQAALHLPPLSQKLDNATPGRMRESSGWCETHLPEWRSEVCLVDAPRGIWRRADGVDLPEDRVRMLPCGQLRC